MGLELVKLNRLACGFNLQTFTASALSLCRLFPKEEEVDTFSKVRNATEILLGIADIFVM